MATNDNSDYGKKRTNLFELLPSVHQSDTNRSIFENTFNRFLSKPEVKKISGFVGQGNPNAQQSRQIEEPTVRRQAYQLQPLLYSKIGTINHMASYTDILNEISRIGVDIDRLPMWGNTVQFNWVPPVDLNKLLNYQDYYWVDRDNPSGAPQYITIKSECSTAEALVSAYEQMIDQIGGSTFSIVGLDATEKTITVPGALNEVFIDGFVFTTKDSTNVSINNAIWTTVSSTYDEMADTTTIVVVEPIMMDVPVDGIVSLDEFLDLLKFNKNCVCDGSSGWAEGGWDDNQVGMILWSDNVRAQIIVDPAGRPTSPINGSMPAEPFDLWWDTATDRLYQLPPSPTIADPLDGSTWTIVWQNFGSLIEMMDGTYLWNFRTTCQLSDVQTDAADQWIDANKWVHKNDVETFGIAKRAQLPIIEFFSTLELNEWTVTEHKWKFRIGDGLPFEDFDGEPNIWELTPLELFTYNIAKNEVIFDERYGDMTHFLTPGTRVVFENSVTGTNGVIEVVSSHYGVNHVSDVGVSLNRTRVIFDLPLGALDDDDGRFIPFTLDFSTERFVDYNVHWVYAGVENTLPINHQTKNSNVEIDPISTPIVEQNYTYQRSPYAQEFIVTVDGTDLFVLDGDPRPGATRTRRQLSLKGFDDIRVYKNDIRIRGEYEELTQGDLIESFVFQMSGVETPGTGILGTPRWFIVNGSEASTVMQTGMQLYVEESGEADGRYLLQSATYDAGNDWTIVEVAPQEFLVSAVSPVNSTITVDTDATDYFQTGERVVWFSGTNDTYLVSTVTYDQFSDTTTVGLNDTLGVPASLPGTVVGSLAWGLIPDTATAAPFGEITATEGDTTSQAVFTSLTQADQKYVAAVRLTVPANRTDVIRIEVGESSEDDLGRYAVLTRTIEDDATFNDLGPECISLVRYRKVEQVKVQDNQYPLFDLYNCDGTSANRAEPIIEFATSETAQLNSAVGLRIVVSQDGKNFGFMQNLVDEDNGPMFFYRDYTLRENDYWVNAEQIFRSDDEADNIQVRYFNCDAWETKTHMGRFYATPIVSETSPTVASHPQFEGYVGPTPTGALEDGILWFDVKNRKLYCRDNQALQGQKFPWIEKTATLSFADPTLSSIWKPGNNKEEYVPTYRDSERRADGDVIGVDENGDPITLDLPVGDPDGDWELANQMYFNPCHENRKCFHLTQLVRHINTIVDEQQPQPGVLGRQRDRWRTLVNPNYGVGGTIREHNDSYDSFLSATFVNSVTVPTLIEWAQEQYEILLNQIEEHYRENVVAILTNLQTDFRMLDTIVPETILDVYENNIANAFVYGDTTAFVEGENVGDPDIGIRNWITTLPMLCMRERCQPVISQDATLGFRELVHHDGHRSNVELPGVFRETIIQRVVGTLDPRSEVPPYLETETFGRQSAMSFPTTYQTFINPAAPNFFSEQFRSGVFWYETNSSTRTLWHLLIDYISGAQPSTLQPDGTLWLDLSTAPHPTLNILVSNVWTPVTSTGDGIIASAWTPVDVADLFAETMLETEQRLYDVSPRGLHQTAFDFSTLTVTPEEAEVEQQCKEQQFLEFVRETELTPLPFSAEGIYDPTLPFTWNYVYSTMSVNPHGFTGFPPIIGNKCTITATAGQTIFPCVYTPGHVQVFVNGAIELQEGVDFTATTGVDIVLTVPAVAGDTYDILDSNDNRCTIIATAGQTLFPCDYTIGAELVAQNGQVLTNGVDYTATTGTDITLLVPATAGDQIDVLDTSPPFTPQTGGGVPSPGGVWQDLYFKLYGTPYPHLEPWTLQGYKEKPGWWDGEYLDTTGTRRWIYDHATQVGMWENIRRGVVPAGYLYPDGCTTSTGTPSVDGQNLPKYVYFSVNIGDVPVDNGTGPIGVDELLPPYWNFEDEPTLGPGYLGPIRSCFFLLNFEIVDPGADYRFGDRGLYEWLWFASTRSRYDDLICAYIMQPVRFLHHALGEEFTTINCLQISTEQEKPYTSKDAIFHGDLLEDKTKAKKKGLLQWYVNYNRFTETDMNASDFRPLWSGWRTPLAYQFASFLDTTSLFVQSSLFDITSQDYEVFAKRSPGVENHFVDSFDISITHIPPSLLGYNNEADWRFALDSLSPLGTARQCYGVQNYPWRVDPETSICTIYQYDIVESRSAADRIAVRGNQAEAFSAGTNITITGFDKTPIVGVNQGTPSFIVNGDVTGTTVPGFTFQVTESVGDPAPSQPTISNNGTYTVVSSSFAAGQTTVVVVEPIPGPYADGVANFNNNGNYTVERSQYSSSLDWTLITLNENLPDATDPASGVVTADFRKLPWQTGDEIYFFTTRLLPAPLMRDTKYNVIVLNDTQFRVAEDPIRASLNDFIYLGDTSQGLHTVGKIRSTFFALAQQTTDQVWYHHEIDRTYTRQVLHPFQVNGAQNLINVMDGCIALAEDAGFRFNESKLLIDRDNGRLINWQYEQEKFLDFIHRIRTQVFARSERYEVEVDVDTNVFTYTDQTPMYATGQKVLFISNGIVPSPMMEGEPVFYIRISETQFAVAATLEDARAGIPVDILNQGSGTVQVQTLVQRPQVISAEVNAFTDALWFVPTRGVVADVVRGPFPDVRIDQLFYDQNGAPLRNSQLKVFREDKITEIRMKEGLQNPNVPAVSPGSLNISCAPGIRQFANPLFDERIQYLHISGAQLFIDGHEHVVVFDDCTQESHLIYDAWAGLNTPRIFLEFDRQPEFTQRPNLGGHFLTVDGELKRNLEAGAFDIQTFYDTHIVSETLDTSRYSRNLLGYEGLRDDLRQLRINPKSQFIFWRGLIHQKGTTDAVNAFTQSRRFISANIDEYWAYELAQYGDAGDKEYPAVKLFTTDARDNELILRFLNPAEEDLISEDSNITFVVDPGFNRPDFSERWHLQPMRLRELSNTANTLWFGATIDRPMDFGDPITIPADGYDINPFEADPYDSTSSEPDDIFLRHDFDSDSVVITYKLWPDGTQETICPSATDVGTVSLFPVRRYLPNTGAIRIYRQPAVGDGRYLEPFVDFTEFSSSEIQLSDPIQLNEKFTVIHQAGILRELILLDGSDPGYDVEDYDTTLYDSGTGNIQEGQYERVNAKVIRFPMSIADVQLLMTNFVELTLHAAQVSKAAHNPVEIIDTENDQRVSLAPIWDPARNRHYHLAESVIDYQNDNDVALYTDSLNPFEVITATMPEDVAGSLSGTHWRIWSANDETSYYVWYNVAARAEVTPVTCPADVAGSLDGKHWILRSANNVTRYYVWYDVDAGGNDPGALGTAIPVSISSNDTALDVAIATAAAINGVIDFSVPVPTDPTITITNVDVGPTIDTIDVNSGIVVGNITQGVNPTVDPVAGGTAVEVPLTGDATDFDVAVATAAALDALNDFSVPVPGNKNIQITLTRSGSTNDPEDVTSGVSFPDIIQSRIDESFWHQPEVGRVWLDTSRMQYVPYYDDKVFSVQQDRLNNWGRLADWAQVKVYEWVASDVPPEEYNEQAELETGDLSIDERLKKTGTVRSHAFRRDRDHFTFTTQPQTTSSTHMVVDTISGDLNANTITGLNYDHSQSFRATGGETTFRLSRPYIRSGTIPSTTHVVAPTLSVTVNGQSLPATLPGPIVLSFTEDLSIDPGQEAYEFTVSSALNLDDLVTATVNSPNYGIRVDVGTEVYTFVESGTNLNNWGDILALLERDIDTATFDFVDNTFRIEAKEVGVGNEIRVVDTLPIGGLRLLESILGSTSPNLPSTGPDNPGTFPADDTGSQTDDGVNTLFTTTTTPHTFPDGSTVLVSTTQTLPNGLDNNTIYTVFDSNQNQGTFRLQDENGTTVEVSDVGEGTHTVASTVWPTNEWKREVDVRESFCVVLDHDLRAGTDTIVGINQTTPSFEVSGDQTGRYVAGEKFSIANSNNEENDGVYTIVSSTFVPGTTTIVVAEPIPSALVSGTAVKSRSFVLTKFDEGDEVKVYVNGRFSIDFTVDSTFSLSRFDIQDTIQRDFDFTDADYLDVVRFAHDPTDEELTFDPDDTDDGTTHIQYVISIDHSITNEVQSDGTLRPTYYFWVENSANGFERIMAPRQAQQELVSIPIPYSVFIGNRPYERVLIDEQYVPFPERYTTIAVRGLRGVINSDDRYVLRFTRDFTLRNRVQNGEPHGTARNWIDWSDDSNIYNNPSQADIDLKNLHREWQMFRERQISSVPFYLWQKLTEAVVGNKLGDPATRVPSLAAELYDEQFGTQERIGLGDGQAFTDRETSLATILSDLNDPNNDFKPVDVETFLMNHSFDTPENIEKAMVDMYNTFDNFSVNRIFFKCLYDAFTFQDKYRGLMKTSMVSINGVRILEVNGIFDD